MSESTNIHSYLSFKLGGESFATGVEKVREILQLDKITKVPHSPHYMKGVINLRGTVLPVIDTRVKFGMSPIEITDDTCIIVLHIYIGDEELLLGAMVDAVSEVFETASDKINPSPSLGNKYRSEFIKGIIKADEAFIILLDVDKVFSLDEAVMVREATPQMEV